MQSKIIDFASDKIAKTLNKIDKNDVKKAVTGMQGRWQKRNAIDKNAKSVDDLNKETNNEEYCDMLKNEFKLKETNSTVEKQEKRLRNDSERIDVDDENIYIDEDNFQVSSNETGEINCATPDKSTNRDISSFVQKKNIAQGMMDVALVSANCNQLRYVLDMSGMHPYYLTSIILICTSLAMQLIVGLGLLWSNGYNLKRKNEMQSANRFNNISVIGVFLITLINVFISTFNGTNIVPKEAATLNASETLQPIE
ncbi:unnamed protein product [Diamesa serratosioi]